MNHFCARKKNLVVREFDDEVIVYDKDTHRAHCLNRTAALVFEHCDGTRSPQAIAQSLSDELQRPVDERGVLAALERLSNCNLLDDAFPSVKRGMSRRQFVKAAGMAAAVTTIVAPLPAAHASCKGPGSSCQKGPDCCSGNCVGPLKLCR